jgi:hypothetical protein
MEALIGEIRGGYHNGARAVLFLREEHAEFEFGIIGR